MRAKELSYGLLSCTGRLTVTGMLISIGKQFKDWTAAYQLFIGERMNVEKLFEVSSQVCLENLSQNQMLVAHMDDTIIRKVGKKIFGTSWRRDPLGPAFHTNFIWAQRFIQISFSLHDSNNFNSQSRAIPVDFHHSPTVGKPSKNATPEELILYKEHKKNYNLSRQGLERIKLLRARLDKQGAKDRPLILSVDGSYTNETILKNLPDRVTLIGRVRKDIVLNKLPEQEKTKGRNRVYGEQLPTPEQIRQSTDFEWQEIKAWAAGQCHTFNLKVVRSLKWRVAGKNHIIQLIVIRPLAYRLKKGGQMLYRRPAYLICTDNEMQVDQLLQAYLWRWEIEVNFRDEKTITGAGQAQVRNKISAAKLPSFVVAIHAFVHLAEYILQKKNLNISLPKAKWEKNQTQKRPSTNNLLNLFRGHYWFEKSGKSFSDFVQNQEKLRSTLNAFFDPLNAPFYMRK